MFDLSKAVREFHVKHGFALDSELFTQLKDSQSDGLLNTLGQQLIGLSRDILELGMKDQAERGDVRVYRSHLLLEELGETFIKMARGDETGVADGLGDLKYVLEGTAEAFSIPLDEVTEEIHRSNMTKAVRNNRLDRMRDKGPDYTPPNIAAAIVAGRKRRRVEELVNEGVSIELAKTIVYKEQPNVDSPV